MTTTVLLGILGETTMRMHGKMTVHWAPNQARAVLAVLAAQPNRRIPVTTLIEQAWPEDNNLRRPAGTVQTYVNRIRSKLDESDANATIETASNAYRLAVADPHIIDHAAFTDLAGRTHRAARGQDHRAVVELAEQAMLLWRDIPLAGVDTVWAANWRAAVVTNEWLPLNVLLLDAYLALDQLDTARRLLDELQREHTDLSLVQRRLRLLHSLGQHDDASALYIAKRRELRDDEDPEAADNLRDYVNQLPEATQAAQPPVITAKRPAAGATLRRHLPPDIPDFVGRTELEHQLDAWVRAEDGGLEPGVIVLDGLAGVGKTALAIHWAHRQVGSIVDNAIYLDLQGYTDDQRREPGEVVEELLRAFDVPIARLATQARREARLREVLARNRTLVVLDNAVNSAHVRPLLMLLSPCLVLVTSRQRLTGLTTQHGARHRAVTGLSGDHATALLESRISRKAHPEAVARLAGMCAGLPLVLQLVAHHVDLRHDVTIEQFAREFADRSRLLDMGEDGDEPHVGLRTALSFSYQGLPEPTQRLFRLLGGFPLPEITLYAAAAVAGLPVKEVQRHLDVLVSTHLLNHAGTLHRYRLHDLVRAYAAELTSHSTEDERRHAERRLLSFYLHSTYRADRILFPTRVPVPMLPPEPGIPECTLATEHESAAWLSQERANLVALVPWAAGRSHHDCAWRLPHNLYGIFRRYGHYADLRAAFEIAVSSTMATADLEAEGATRSDLGRVCLAVGDYHESRRQFHLAALIANQMEIDVGIAISLLNLGNLEATINNLTRATDLYREALAKAREAGDFGAEGSVVHHLARTLRLRGRRQDALEHYHRALELRKSIADEHGLAETLAELADTMSDLEDHAAAKKYSVKALAIVRRIRDVEASPRVFVVLATVHYRQHLYRDAVRYARQAARLALHTRNAQAEADALHILAHALDDLGHHDAAEEGWHRSRSIYADLDDTRRLRHAEANLARPAGPHASVPGPRYPGSEPESRGGHGSRSSHTADQCELLSGSR